MSKLEKWDATDVHWNVPIRFNLPPSEETCMFLPSFTTNELTFTSQRGKMHLLEMNVGFANAKNPNKISADSKALVERLLRDRKGSMVTLASDGHKLEVRFPLKKKEDFTDAAINIARDLMTVGELLQPTGLDYANPGPVDLGEALTSFTHHRETFVLVAGVWMAYQDVKRFDHDLPPRRHQIGKVFSRMA